jgi:twinkle protein
MGVQILTHQPCPDCGSSDALTVYDWGTKCFSCRKSNFDSQNAGLQSLKKDDKAFRFVNGITRTIVDRKLNKNTCEFFGLVEANDQYYFPYCDEDGNLVAYKKRQISDKKFSVEGNWQRGRLFGQHLFPAGQSILTICEGEFDAMSAWQMMGGTGKYAVVSVRNGAGSAIADCKNNYEYIDSFETIHVCFDADPQGQDAAQQVAELFGSKVKIFKADSGLKDASDYLQRARADRFLERWWASERYVPDGIVDGSTLWDLVSQPMEDSLLNYPYKGLNDLTYGIRPNEMVLAAAGSGLGKSQFMRELVYHILNNSEENIGLLFLEETVRTTARSMMSLYANKLLHLPTTQVTDEELRESFEATLGTGRLFLFDSNGDQDKDKIVSRVKYMAKALNCKYIFLDHISIIVAGAEKGSEREALEEIMRALRVLVKETEICLFGVSHLRRPEGKGHEEGALTSLAQLKGSTAQGNTADIVIGLERNGQHEDEAERHTTRVRVLKNRFSGLTGPACRLLYNKQTGRMTERFDEDAL